MAQDPLDQYNVVWDTPSKDSSGSMPLGNGDIGLNLWVEENGDLRFYISKTDAWDEHARLLKLGGVRLKLSPDPFRTGLPFRQELRLRQGEIVIVAGRSPAEMTIRVWVDANLPVIHVEAEGEQPFGAKAILEMWRTQKRELPEAEWHGVDRFAKNEPPSSYPDTLVSGRGDQVVWYHRNEKSLWPVTLRHQGLETLIGKQTDPLLHRMFGGAMKGERLVLTGAGTLEPAEPSKRLSLAIYVLTAQTETPEAWLSQLDQTIAAVDAVEVERARAEHREWWDAFWNRSWVRVTASRDGTAARPMERNRLPLRIGADSDGANRLVGEIGRAAVYNRALTAEEIMGLAAGREGAPDGCVAAWDWSKRSGEAFESAVPGGPAAKLVGSVEVVEGRARAPAVRLTDGYLEAAHCDALDLVDAVTLEAWIRPGELPPGGGRILDKSQAGTSNGYLLDTYPGGSLRLIVADGTLSHDAKLTPGRWVHVAAIFDARTGEKNLYVMGQQVAAADQRPEHLAVSQGYVLQRFIGACGGRGKHPIKFNGSIFTVDVPGQFDPDYRRWGGCYWFQNTRLPYWPMLASGDFDLMPPLFSMYRDALDLALERNRVYFGHGGAFFPETIHFWGTYHNGSMGYGWDREGKGLWPPDNPYIGIYWSGGLELTAMMLDYYAFTGDRSFLRETLLPVAEAVVTCYDEHFERDAEGKIRFEPAHSLETWWDCVNPLPEVAGLRFVVAGLLSLPGTTEVRRAQWDRVLGELPAVPTRQVDGETILSPAETFADRHNVENPELYAIFPYRLYGVGKSGLETARRTFEHRLVKVHHGWSQDDIEAALLGLTDQARTFVSERARNKDEGSRFPAFWGPNYDWIPDQDHGANLVTALQMMLMQWDGDKILLFPAWPKDWDVEFKLHAPRNTIVEGVYQEGRLERLRVTPAEREKDIVRCDQP
jgi:hypothetical protein